MKNDLVSIIIPIYNVEAYLKECLESIFALSHPNLEVLLVNDGSTDGSLAIAKEFNEKYPHISILIDKANGGLSSARNAGLSIAKGDWVAFIDSDDYVNTSGFDRVLKSLAETKSDIVAFNGYQYFDDTGETKNLFKISRPVQSGKQLEYIDFLGEFLKRGMTNIVTVWDKVYRRSILTSLNITFIEGILHEDIPFTLALAAENLSVVYIDERVIYYRQRSGSIMSVASPKKLQSKIVAINNVIDTHKRCHINNIEVNEYLVFMVSYLTRQGSKLPNSLLWRLQKRKLKLKKRFVLCYAQIRNLFN